MAKEANCPKCRALPANDRVVTQRPRDVWEVADVMTLGPVLQTEHIHSVDVGWVVARHTLRGKIACSLPDKTPHKSGCVADARCGVRLILGHDCAKSHVAGWSRVVDALKELDEREAALNKVQRLVEFRERIAKVDLRLARIPQAAVYSSEVLSHMQMAHAYARRVADMASDLSHASSPNELKKYGSFADRAFGALVSAENAVNDLAAKEIARQQELAEAQAPKVRSDIAAEFRNAGKRR
jgi:hypothetical protein